MTTASIDILHVPFTYFPDPVGGTETYVAGLVHALVALGISSAIAAPGAANVDSEHDGFAVYRFACAPNGQLDQAYGVPDEIAATNFASLLRKLRPRLVHLHAHTAAISAKLVDAAHAVGAVVVFTYHTPTASCVRGTMLRMGIAACDGRQEIGRCTNCVLQSHGVPSPFRRLLAITPQFVGDAIGRAGLAGGGFTALRMKALVSASHRQFRDLVDKVDHVVAVCDWVADVMSINDVAPSKVTLCRQGVETRPVAPRQCSVSGAWRRPLKIGYFGRIDRTKGVDLLIDAFGRLPDAEVQLDIYGVSQLGSDDYRAQLDRGAANDRRVFFHPALEPDQVAAAMSDCDLVAIPSRWLETGPLVALEAFGAGTPVLGARLGGITELVNDGVNGVLADSGDPDAWATIIGTLANHRDRVTQLRSGVRPPRAIADVAREMAALYQSLLLDQTA